jgi:hypothetical protein
VLAVYCRIRLLLTSTLTQLGYSCHSPIHADVAGRGPAPGPYNLSIANMDWDDFAGSVDGDGVFRGFGG